MQFSMERLLAFVVGLSGVVFGFSGALAAVAGDEPQMAAVFGVLSSVCFTFCGAAIGKIFSGEREFERGKAEREAELSPRINLIVDNMSSNMGVMVSRLARAQIETKNSNLVSALDTCWHTISLLQNLVEISGGDLAQTKAKLDSSRQTFAAMAGANDSQIVALLAEIGAEISQDAGEHTQQETDRVMNLVSQALNKLTEGQTMKDVQSDISAGAVSEVDRRPESARCPKCGVDAIVMIAAHLGASADGVCSNGHAFHAHRGRTGLFTRQASLKNQIKCSSETCDNVLTYNVSDTAEDILDRYCFQCGTKSRIYASAHRSENVASNPIITSPFEPGTDQSCPKCNRSVVTVHENPYRLMAVCSNCDCLVELEKTPPV